MAAWPFNVRAIMIEQDNRPFVGKPVKMQSRWRDLERRAMRHGSPTFVGNGELFWGDDRLEDAIEWAKSHST